jgi:hypothetical protein
LAKLRPSQASEDGHGKLDWEGEKVEKASYQSGTDYFYGRLAQVPIIMVSSPPQREEEAKSTSGSREQGPG